MRRVVWCPCGCNERKLLPVLPMKARRLMHRRLVAEHAARQRAAWIAAAQAAQANRLAAAAPGGNA